MEGGYVYVFDGFSGTCTSACLHALRTMRRVQVVCIDRDHSLDYIRAFIPCKYWEKVLYIQDDITDLDSNKLLSRIQAVWPDAKWKRFIHLHLSPSCQTYSRTDRGLSAHRDRYGRPLTPCAKEDDSALRHAVKLVLEIHVFCPTACITIENSVSWTFGLVPCITHLCWSSNWHWLTLLVLQVRRSKI